MQSFLSSEPQFDEEAQILIDTTSPPQKAFTVWWKRKFIWLLAIEIMVIGLASYGFNWGA